MPSKPDVKPPKDIQYDTVVAILYVSYCPMQVPSNLVRRP